MNDIVGRIWAMVFGIMIMFVGSLTLFSLKQDMISQNIVNTATQEFVDISRQTGTVTKSQYQNFISKLDSTKNIYTVKMQHFKQKTAVVGTDGAPQDRGDSFETYFMTYTQDEILDSIDANADSKYYMSPGDFFKVTVTNTTPTLGRRLLGVFIFRPTNTGGQIYSSYGGKVGND